MVCVGLYWARVGTILGLSWAILGYVGTFWAMLAPYWAHVGPFWVIFGSVAFVLDLGISMSLNFRPCKAFAKNTQNTRKKSAHTALAVKACLLGGNSNTKCSMTFVNIAVAISALAGGGQKRFRTETRIRWCCRHFSRIFGCLSARGY